MNKITMADRADTGPQIAPVQISPPYWPQLKYMGYAALASAEPDL